MIKLWRKIVAFLSGTFVADCPKCHKHFYGFHDYAEHVKIEKKNYRIVCHRCSMELKALEEKKKDVL
jgi:uncharacterized C2H2 Zn-finger protein